MKVKQAQLKELSYEEARLMSAQSPSIPAARSIILAADLSPWSQQTTPTDPPPHMFPYDRCVFTFPRILYMYNYSAYISLVLNLVNFVNLEAFAKFFQSK